MMINMEKISVIIPCYNSEATISHVVEDVIKELEGQKNYNYEVILINDNSVDNTFRSIEELCINENIQGVSLARNFGQHAALMAGFNKSSGDIILCMDDDGQTPANQIFKLINGLNETTDVVYAMYSDKKHNFFRNIGSRINDIMAVKLLNKPKKLQVTSFFAAKKYVINEVIKYNNPFPYVIGLVLRVTDKIENVSVDHKERMIGNSGYTITKLLSLWINGFTSFSVKPLRVSTLIGIVFAFLGFLYATYIVINRIINPEEVLLGWSSLIAIIMISSGVLMIMLGLIGEYIGRVFISLNKSPQYVIRDEVVTNEKSR